MSSPDRATALDLIRRSRETLRDLVETCDHDVNICWCSELDLLRELEEYIEREKKAAIETHNGRGS